MQLERYFHCRTKSTLRAACTAVTYFTCNKSTGVGVGMTRDTSTLMVAQYFKRKREFVEIFIVAGSGLGLAVMSAFIKGAIG